MQSVFGQDVERSIATREALREVYPEPSVAVAAKVIDHVDVLAQRFLERVPLAFLATRRADGGVDVTPRGDPPGFIHVIDPHTIALPDRPGNNRTDALENILDDPQVGLVCVIPGHGDTLRIAGEARIVEDARLGRATAVNGRPARLVLLIRVERVLSHCPKAFVRARAWKPEAWPDTARVPTLAEMMVAHGNLKRSVGEMAEIIQEDGETRLY